jgi:hypothetical protein
VSTIPITAYRRFEVVTEDEWRKVASKKISHMDLHEALNYLKREPIGTKLRIRCASDMYKKKYAAFREARNRKGMNVETKWDNGWLYMQRVEEK